MRYAPAAKKLYALVSRDGAFRYELVAIDPESGRVEVALSRSKIERVGKIAGGDPAEP